MDVSGGGENGGVERTEGILSGGQMKGVPLEKMWGRKDLGGMNKLEVSVA